MRSFIRAALFAACAAIALPAPAGAWDYPGHRIVGAIADIILQRDHPDAYARALALLERKTRTGIEARILSEVAVFADCAKDEKEFCGRRPTLEEVDYVLRNNVHKSFHYTNSPYQQKKYLAGGVGTLETDIVQMIGHTIEQLQGKRPFFKFGVKLEDGEALWLLVHLVGDIHQPLHVGQAYFDTTCERIINPNASNAIEAVSTLGGNTIKLTGGEAPSLHIYWDANTVAKAMQIEGLSDEKAFARKLAETPPPDWISTGAPETWAEQWIEQTMPLAEMAYGLKIEHDPTKDSRPPFPSATISCGLKTTITPEYEAWSAAQARAQLQKAGYRLAAVVAAILKPQ